MRLDELIEQTTIHEKTRANIDRRVTTAGRTALTCCAVSTAIYNQTRPNNPTDIPGFIIDWFGYPTVGYTLTLAAFLVGAALAITTNGFTKASHRTHQTVVGFIIAATAATIPILLAVTVWILFIAAIIAMFAAAIGFAVLVLWALTQAS